MTAAAGILRCGRPTAINLGIANAGGGNVNANNGLANIGNAELWQILTISGPTQYRALEVPGINNISFSNWQQQCRRNLAQSSMGLPTPA